MYHGGKQRIGKYISEIIQEIYSLFPAKTYVEPFCGMLGVYDHVVDFMDKNTKFYAGDVNKSVIEMWKASQKGWKPPEKCVRKTFENVQSERKISALKGFVGHACTFRGTFLNAFFPQSDTRTKRNSKNVVRLGKKLQKVKFKSGPYTQFSNVKGAIIYCDPPYAGGEQRYYSGEARENRLVFDTDSFWKWAKEMSENNVVLVSEYSPPDKKLKIKTAKLFEKGKERLYLIVP
jgi:site-specific DNA-adenine methylase